jgi:hypothetical protein
MSCNIYTIEEITTDNCTYFNTTVLYSFVSEKVRDSVFDNLSIKESDFHYIRKGTLNLIKEEESSDLKEIIKTIKKELKDLYFR